MSIWSEIGELDLDRLLADLLAPARGNQGGDIMTTGVVTISPEAHLLTNADLMATNHVRRLPVTEEGRPMWVSEVMPEGVLSCPPRASCLG